MKLRFGRSSSSSSSISNTENKSTTKGKCTMTATGEGELQLSDLMKVLLSNQDNIKHITKDISSIKDDISTMKRNHVKLNTKVDGIDARVMNLEAEVQRMKSVETDCKVIMEAHCRSQITAVKAQYNSMAYNVIAYNVEESLAHGETWEKTLDSVDRAYYVLEKVFKIDNARDIPLVTAHRLPSSKTGPRPLIFKFLRLSDKSLLWDNIKNVKKYNDAAANGKNIFVQMIQLPEKLAHDKASLLADFNTAREENQKPKWRFLRKSGIYCYEIGNKQFKPKVNYFLHKFVSDKNEN